VKTARPRRTQEARFSTSRAHILAAALKLFSTVGYHGTSIRDIAQAAGASTGNVYHQFPDKESIFRALLEEYFQQVGSEDFPFNKALAAGAFPSDLEAIARAARESVANYKPYVALIYVDVDRFKAVNDTLGHAVGDRVLRHVADYLRGQVREADYVFRLGGDEFVVLISCGAEEAERKTRELQAGFHATLVEAALPTSLGLSVGIAEVPAGARNLDQAIQQADARMYEDKRRRATSALGE